MNYSTGLSILFHLMINTYHNFIKKYPARALSAILVILVTVLVILKGKASVTNTWKENNFQLAGQMIQRCLPVHQEPSNQRVILRLDDVQAYAYTDITEKIIDETISHNMKMTLGVIPNNFLEDVRIDGILKRNSCNLELAIHGWDHISPRADGTFEFEEMSKEEALIRIRRGKEIFKKITNSPIVTFIPPGNKISVGTKEALSEEGIKYISADDSETEYGMNATTYDFPAKKLIENSKVIEACDKRFSANKLCVIVIHPQDYLTDDKIDLEKFKQYIDLLDQLKKKSVFTTTFKDL